jgi:crotonobetainyl-CoA:carnitine CoA-transferase CaiB-like acyl-CoA transferase
LWARCARVLGHPEWGADPRFATGPERVRNKGELIPLIQAALRERTRAEWLNALAAAGVPSGPVNDIAELAATEQLAAVGIVQELPEGGPRVVGLPISFDRRRPRSARRAPRLGEHNGPVLGRP